jgi:hypothetical protein
MEYSVNDERYKVVDDIIYYKYHIHLVPESTLKENIMVAMNDAPLEGHPRYLKHCRKIKERITWKGLKDDVLKNVRDYVTFQQKKSKQTHHVG